MVRMIYEADFRGTPTLRKVCIGDKCYRPGKSRNKWLWALRKLGIVDLHVLHHDKGTVVHV